MQVLQSAGDVFWGPAELGVIIVEFFFASFGVIERPEPSERFLVVFMERCEDFLCPVVWLGVVGGDMA